MKAIIFVLALTLSHPLLAHECADSMDDPGHHRRITDLHVLSTKQSQDQLKAQGFNSKKAKGYAILIATMIGSALLTSQLTAALPANFQFVSMIVAQLSTLGVYVMGSPIWEPLSSKFRRMAFGMADDPNAVRTDNENLESMWYRTQGSYSHNAQTSRHTLNDFITSVQRNFYGAYYAMHSDDVNYAADQLAEAAVRLRHLFKDISPTDPYVTLAIHAAFTNHIQEKASLRELTWKKIEVYDQEARLPDVSKYYRALLDTWLA